MGENLGPFLRRVDRTVKVTLSNQEIVDRTERMTALYSELAAAEARFEEAKATFKAQKLRIERELAPVIREIGEKKAPRVQQVDVHRHPDRHDFVLEVFNGDIIAEREIEKADTQLRLPDAAVPDPVIPEVVDDQDEGVEPLDEDDDGEIPWDDIDDEVDEVIESGRTARRDGVPRDDNPYREDDDEHVRWARGWDQEHPIALFAEGAAAREAGEGAAAREAGEEDDEEQPAEWRRGWAAASTPGPPERLDLETAIRTMSPPALEAYLDGIERAELYDIYHRICGVQAKKGRRTKGLIIEIKEQIAKDKAAH